GLLKQNNVPGATAKLQSSLTPESSGAVDYTLGNLYYQNGQMGQAIRSYQNALRKFPGFVRAKKNLGLALMQENRFEEARPLLVAVIEQDGADATVYSLLAYGYFLDERYASALEAYDNALLLNPKSRESQIGRAQALYAVERYEEAIAAFEEILQDQPQRQDVWLMQANAYLALDKPERAAANIEVVRRLGQAGPEALMLLGDIYLSDGLPKLAAKVYTEALDSGRKPSATEALRAATLLADRGAWDDSEALLTIIESQYQAGLNSDQATSLLSLKAQIALSRGDSDAAAKILRALLERDPLNGKALLLLANYEWEREQYEEASLLYERAERLPELEAEAKVQHARMLVAQKDYAAAAKLLRQAQNLRPRENVARYLESVERAGRSSL
ncbi:MAG: tetratricopeptide repeat protein, partial [Puniceicoccales bacterium]